jgi:integrase/recombinase XerC
MVDYTPSRLVRSFGAHRRELPREAPPSRGVLRSRGRRLEDATKADLEDFLADLLARRSASTAATWYKVLRILYRWLEEEEDVPSPIAKMKPPIVPKQPVPVIPATGLRRLLKVCEGKGFEARRDTVLIMLLLDTGARRGELVGLKLADDRPRPGRPPGTRQGSPRARPALRPLGHSATRPLGHSATRPLGHKAALALDRYLRVRDRHKHADLPWLWIGLADG